jgi:hypothetical protein
MVPNSRNQVFTIKSTSLLALAGGRRRRRGGWWGEDARQREV